MRYLLLPLFVATAVCAADKDGDKPLSPEVARTKVGEKVFVEMTVRASKDRLEKHKEIYLDSKQDFKDPNNLEIVITLKGAAKLKEAGMADPAGHLLNKIIRVRGIVILKDERPRIEVDAPNQLTEVKGK